MSVVTTSPFLTSAMVAGAILLAACSGGSAPDSARPADPPAARAAAPAPDTAAGTRADTGVPDRLRSIIATQLKVSPERVTPNASFKELGADDLSMVELVMAYEREFKVRIADADADRFRQVRDVADYLRAHDALK
jgi:acyl carrier protein